MEFTKLRLSGFKSFVEPTELLIEPGLTGIVGPNGCGKSNLVEALRWVMGETSAKQMRGGEMEDVIFSGTRDRPPRNIAEVILSLANRDRSAPAMFNDHEELDVSRRIERSHGSTYRVNGREVRARDVQLLFADAASGPRSTALVSQGRVGNVVSAKAGDRRLLLEEAAGITGLHSRRHEAELRLRGAESNLERLDDILGTLEVQYQTLKKQARQAARYRNLNGHLRRAEALLLYLRWRAAQETLAKEEERFRLAQTAVAAATKKSSETSTVQAEIAAELPVLRQSEAEAAAALQRLSLEHERLAEDEQRAAAALEGCDARLTQIRGDMDRGRSLVEDADAAIERLTKDIEKIQAARQGEGLAIEQAEAQRANVQETVANVENQVNELAERVAADEAGRAALIRSVSDRKDRLQRLEARSAEIQTQRADLESRIADEITLAEAADRVTEAQNTSDGARDDAERKAERRRQREEASLQARSTLQTAESAVTKLQAELLALKELLEVNNSGEHPPLLDSVSVEPGYEEALGAALGEDLAAAADPEAPIHWRNPGPPDTDPPLPGGVESLANVVSGPSSLDRRVAQIGVVRDDEHGKGLASQLRPGQRLVSRDGALWRWDGYTISSGAATTTAIRLRQRNRLEQVRALLKEAEAKADRAREIAVSAKAAAENAVQEEKAAREEARTAEVAYARAREAQIQLKEKHAEVASRLAAMNDAAANIEAERRESMLAIQETELTLSQLPDLTAARQDIAEKRAELAERRSELTASQSLLDNLVRDAKDRRLRHETLVTELDNWRRRRAGAIEQLEQLEERWQREQAERDRIVGLPETIAAKKQSLLSRIEEGEGRHRICRDRVVATEERLSEADRNRRQADTELASAREDQVRVEGTIDQARHALNSLSETITERLRCSAEQLPQIAEVDLEKPLADIEATEKRLERLQRERETMGPVNLRAEQEAAELHEQIASLQQERADLIRAIEKLRRGIAELNREGRQRLLASFEEVDGHFRSLFTRLFGGGRAHLALTESDDPLQAGLEIMASPPGKRLQVLSLLSGGEQALTALALLFAVFLTNPAPLCVLDEVDAPLDDANVDRFCSLVGEMASPGKTHFLVITHHRMTMARMDRLYGVTMSERGISQLVSVDLRRAEELRDIA